MTINDKNVDGVLWADESTELWPLPSITHMSNQNINTHEQKSLKGTVWINLVEVSSRTVNDWMNELNHLGVGGSPIDLSMIV